MNSAIRYTFFIFLILLLGTSCSPLRYLGEDQTMLRKNTVEIENKKSVDDYKTLNYELETLTSQRPNSKFFGVPTLGPWFYYRTVSKMQNRQDTTWWNRFVLKNLAEEPTVYNPNRSDESAGDMEQYMKQRGYFDAEVGYESKRKGWFKKRKIEVTYKVNPGQRYYFDTINYISKDTIIEDILKDIQSESFLQKGVPLDSRIVDQERRRINDYLRNHGYANFYTNYIKKLVADSLTDNGKINVDLEILLTKDSVFHKTYRVGEVAVISMFDDNGDPVMAKDTILNGTRYYLGDEKHFIKLKTLDREIFLSEGDIYQNENINKTRVQLSNLDIFQFVDVRRLPITSSDSILNYEIRLIPKKRQEVGLDFEFNNSRTAANANNNNNTAFLGTAVSISYRNRNVFRGGEVFTAQAEGGVEVVPNDFVVNAWNLNLSGNIDFPKYYDVVKTDWLFTKLRYGKNNKFYQKLKEEGISNASLRYNILSNTNSYRIGILAASLGWRHQQNNNLKIKVNKVAIDFLNPVLDSTFNANQVQNNPFLERSLTNQLFTGFLFRNINLTYQKENRRGGNSSWLAIGNFEQSGFEVGVANWVRNQIAGNEINFELFDRYEFSRYLKWEGELRHYNRFKGGRMFASRLNVGLATDYGLSTEVPYVKQFFVGGPTSLRGWRIRELGPGSYQDPNPPENTNFYQTGDFKLEANLEYRFHLIWYLKGALFVDAGNIWALNDDDRPGSGFDDFAKEIAVNTGFGLRLDVDYFVIRSDFGYQLRNPFPNEDGDYWLLRSSKDLALNKFRWQLAVGYPF